MPVILLTLGFLFAFFRELWVLVKDPRYRSLFFWVIIILVVGTLFYSWVEGWSLLDSLYFSVVSLATVGYGDLAPVTAAGRAFAIVYILFGLSLLATFVHMLAKERGQMAARRFAKASNEDE
jgi:predicted membrane protein